MPIPQTQMLTYQIVTVGTQATGGSSVTPSINVWYYKRTTTAVSADKAALAAAFSTAVLVPLVAAMNIRYAVNAMLVRNVDDVTDIPMRVASALVGAIATDSLPSDDAVYFRLYTLLRGKNYRGGKHFSPASEIDTTNDLLTGAGLARWQGLKAAMALTITDATPNTWNPVVLSASLSQIKRNPTTVVATPISSVVLDANIGTMRRRRSRTVTA